MLEWLSVLMNYWSSFSGNGDMYLSDISC